MSTVTVEMIYQVCIDCGITFAAPKAWDVQRIADRRRFYCPNGHTQCYSGKTEAEKLREQLATKAAECERQRESAQRSREMLHDTQKKLDACKKRKARTPKVVPK